MEPQTQTKAKVERSGSLAILRFEGDVTSASKEAVLGTYDKLAPETKEILLDFSKVQYLNSSGIALVIQLLMEANKSGHKVQTFGLTPHFQKVFTMLGLTKYTSLHPNELAAKAASGG
jgi:anti-sigma B factor antagonist